MFYYTYISYEDYTILIHVHLTVQQSNTLYFYFCFSRNNQRLLHRETIIVHMIIVIRVIVIVALTATVLTYMRHSREPRENHRGRSYMKNIVIEAAEIRPGADSKIGASVSRGVYMCV